MARKVSNERLGCILELIKAGKDDDAMKLATIDDVDGILELCIPDGTNDKDRTSLAMRYLDICVKGDQFDETFSDLWLDKAFALYLLSKDKAVIKCCDKAIEIDPTDNRAWCYKGFALANFGKSSEAIKCFGKAIEVEDQDGDAYYGKCIELLKLKKYHDALESIENVIPMDEQEPKFWKAKAEALDGLGRHDEAKKCLETANKVGPSKNWILIMLTERRDIR